MNKESEPFRGGYFGMPLVLGPYEIGQNQYLIWGRRNQLVVLEPDGLGFRISQQWPLPVHPKDPAYDFLDGPGEADQANANTRFEILRNAMKDVGYQLGEAGEIFWVGSSEIFKHGNAGWKPWFVFPKEFSARRNHHVGGAVLLPRGRVALFGGQDFFLQIVEPQEDPNQEPKVLSTTRYDLLGGPPTWTPSLKCPEFCIAGGNAFFYFGQLGRMLRVKLETWTLTEYDVPWMYQVPGLAFPENWKNGSTPDAPVLPESMAFAIAADGTVAVRALMYNLDTTTIHSFEMGPDGSTIHAQAGLARDLPDPVVFRNSKGDLEPIQSAVNSSTRNKTTSSGRSTIPGNPGE